MSVQALPPHLRLKKHNDWIWPFNKLSRGWNAKGPREKVDSKDYLPWPPKLVEGKGVARWEESGEGGSIIMIPDFIKATIKGSDVYNRRWDAIEMNPGMPDFQQRKKVFLAWRSAAVTDITSPAGGNITRIIPQQYSPSALQKFSPSGWMKLSPNYHSKWKVIKKRELPVWPETGDDTVLFTRAGNRPDHLDVYYNVDKILPIGQIGLKWE